MASTLFILKENTTMKHNKIYLFILTSLIFIMTACGVSESTISDNSISENIIEEPKEITVEALDNSIHTQFTDISSYTISMYISDFDNSYSEDNLYMIMAQNTENYEYSYISGLTEIYVKDDNIYFHNDDGWYVDKVENGGIGIAELICDLNNQSFSTETIIENKVVNNIEYITASFTDMSGLDVTYYFDNNLNFIMSSSKLEKDADQYIYITINLDDFEVPTEVLDAPIGDYQKYLEEKYSSLNE